MDEDDRKPRAIGQLKEDGDSFTPPTKVKPALKRDRHTRQKDKHLQWDEAAIDEHNELRGTRMKIDEPNTPYVYYDSGAESDDSRRLKSPASQRETISWDTLQNRLDSVAAVREQYPSSPSEHADYSDADDDRNNDMRKLEFQEHRKRHYNEFELVKQFRSEHDDEIDSDSEGADNEPNGGNENV